MMRSEWQASVHKDSGGDDLGKRKKGDAAHQCLAHSGEAIGSGFRPFKSTNSVSCRSGSALSLARYADRFEQTRAADPRSNLPIPLLESRLALCLYPANQLPAKMSRLKTNQFFLLRDDPF